MQIVYNGKIPLENFLKLVSENIMKQTNSNTLYNPVLTVKCINSEENVINITDPSTGEPIIIDLNNIEVNEEATSEIVLKHLTDEDLKEHFPSLDLLRICDSLISEGFSINDISYLLDLGPKPTRLLEFYTKDLPSPLHQRKEAWAKYKNYYQSKGKNILFPNDALQDDYVIVPKYRKFTNYSYNLTKKNIPSHNFKSDPIGYITEDDLFVFSLKEESELLQLPLMDFEEIKSPLCVLPYNENNYGSYPYIKKNPKSYQSVGLYWDKTVQNIYEVKNILLPSKYPKIKLYDFNTSPYIPLSSINFKKKLINKEEYRMGYEVGVNTLELLVDVKRFIADNNWEFFHKSEIPKNLIPNNKINLIKYLNYKESLEICAIDNSFNPYYQFNASKFNIPLINTCDISLENTLSISLFELKGLNDICTKLNIEKPYPIAFDPEKNMFFFDVFEDNVLTAWNDFLQSKK